MILEEEHQYVGPELAQTLMDAGMPAGLYCWKPLPCGDDEEPQWELMRGTCQDFPGAVNTWNIGEMLHWLMGDDRTDTGAHRYGLTCLTLLLHRKEEGEIDG